MPNYQGSPKAIDGEGTKAHEAINIPHSLHVVRLYYYWYYGHLWYLR